MLLVLSVIVWLRLPVTFGLLAISTFRVLSCVVQLRKLRTSLELFLLMIRSNTSWIFLMSVLVPIWTLQLRSVLLSITSGCLVLLLFPLLTIASAVVDLPLSALVPGQGGTVIGVSYCMLVTLELSDEASYALATVKSMLGVNSSDEEYCVELFLTELWETVQALKMAPDLPKDLRMVADRRVRALQMGVASRDCPSELRSKLSES